MDAQSVVQGLWGALTVTAQAKDAKSVPVNASINAKITGDNPLAMDVDTYLAGKPEGAGFDKIVKKEPRYKHFNYSGEPIKSFDAGDGRCQLNGGQYHKWDAKAAKWVRPGHIMCDTQTGDFGWNMTDAENKGRTEAELRKRDSASYKGGSPPAGEHWSHFGVCYADRLLD